MSPPPAGTVTVGVVIGVARAIAVVIGVAGVAGVVAVGVVAAGREAGVVLASVERTVAAEFVGTLEHLGFVGAGASGGGICSGRTCSAGSARGTCSAGGAGGAATRALAIGVGAVRAGTVGAPAGLRVTTIARANAPLTQAAQLLDIGLRQISLGRARTPGRTSPPVIGPTGATTILRRTPRALLPGMAGTAGR